LAGWPSRRIGLRTRERSIPYCALTLVFVHLLSEALRARLQATHRAVFFTDCKEAFKEAVLRPGERVAVWDYENGDEQSVERDESAGSRYADDEERYAASEARDDQRSMFHAGEEDLQAFWDLHREAPDLQKIAAQQHTMKPNQEREIDNERHY
jgi:hypothetical protein